MKRNIMAKNLRQSIVKSLARYIAIVAIIALGAGIFVGLRTTKSDMVATGQRFMDEQNMFDLRLLNTYGWSLQDVDRVSALEGVLDAEGVITLDVITRVGKSDSESVYKVYSIPQKINKVYLLGGRMPEAPNECLADGFHLGPNSIGTKIQISESNDEGTLDSLTVRELTVVGYVGTPLYMDLTRGTTTIGNGTVTGYLYFPEESFDVDYFSEIHITLPGENTIYSEKYGDYISLSAERFEHDLIPIASDRFEYVLREAKKAYAEGLAEYKEALQEFQKAKATAKKELADAKKKLEEAEIQIHDNEIKLADGRREWEEGLKTLNQSEDTLSQSKVTLANSKADAFQKLADANAELMKNYITVNDSIRQIDSGLVQINNGISQLDSGISQLESGLQQLDIMVTVTNTMLPIVQSSLDRANKALEAAKANGVDSDLLAELEASVNELQAQVDGYKADLAEMEANKVTYTKQLEDLRVQRQELVNQKTELEQTKATLVGALDQINMGFMEIQNSQTQAENQFAAAEAQLEAAQHQLDKGRKDLDAGLEEIEDGERQLQEAKKELEDGWAEYNQSKEEADREFAEAEQELADAKAELDDAMKSIREMDDPKIYALGRNTNVGYLSLESNSDIVEGVSAVFPAFFLAIAALVCITTMTRMVEEERTQIGTLKALGYSNFQIISKYIIYAGSAAVIGCGLGVVIGSIVFPTILWKAYSIMMLLGDYFVLELNWPLCFVVVGAYTAVTLFVTWFACRQSLKEVPAQLIRPKPPTSGKKIFLEYFPFWNRFSFLNKVMLRNAFRYRQRLLMMMLGIGGCTALLLAGFGVRDSIIDVVSLQFEEITLADMEVNFSGHMTQEMQESFLSHSEEWAEDVFYFHQSSRELVFDDKVNDINFVAAGDGVNRFMDFHRKGITIEYPGLGEAILSIGVAEKLGIQVGDEVVIRDADMRELNLRISGIFENYVNNYIFLSSETVQMQWREEIDHQMAYVSVKDGFDLHEASAALSEYSDVVNITVNQDFANQVGSMLEALDLIVVTIVICSGMLAVIVLYNLTNINITERIREIATIKVLGFNSAESAAYVFKENLFLSVLGSVLGLGFGVLLLEFIMSKIKIDIVWFNSRLLPISYVWAIVFTILSAVLVDFILYFRLEKINMAEALKSVE